MVESRSSARLSVRYQTDKNARINAHLIHRQTARKLRRLHSDMVRVWVDQVGRFHRRHDRRKFVLLIHSGGLDSCSKDSAYTTQGSMKCRWVLAIPCRNGLCRVSFNSSNVFHTAEESRICDIRSVYTPTLTVFMSNVSSLNESDYHLQRCRSAPTGDFDRKAGELVEWSAS